MQVAHRQHMTPYFRTIRTQLGPSILQMNIISLILSLRNNDLYFKLNNQCDLSGGFQLELIFNWFSKVSHSYLYIMLLFQRPYANGQLTDL